MKMMQGSLLAAMALLIPVSAQADHIVFYPTVGDAVVVKDSTGANVLFQGNESGEVIVPGLPVGTSGAAFCRDPGNSQLELCATKGH
jgi:hypothetical protein